MTLETTIATLEATNAELVNQVVDIKTISTDSMNAAISARDRAEQAATSTENLEAVMLQRYDNFEAINEAVTQSDANRNATAADVIYIDGQVTHVDSQTALVDADATQTAADRVQTGLDRVATGEDRVQTGLDRVQTGEDRVQTGLDRASAESDRARAETARINAEALYVDLTAVENAKNATAASEAAAAGSAAAALASEQAAEADRQEVLSQRNHVDSQVVAVDADRQTVAADKAIVATDKGIVAADKATVATDKDITLTHRTAAEAAQAASEAARDKSSDWATGTGVIATIGGTGRYSSREEADRALAERNAADASAAAALIYKNAALASQNAAATSEGNALASENAADAHRLEAQRWASEEEDIEIAPGLFSSRHYMLKAMTIATGTLIYIGTWDASTGAFPSPEGLATGHFYKVSVTGTVGAKEFLVGDQIIFNGTGWDHIDNTERVSSVGGYIGEVSDIQLREAVKRVDGAGSGLDADTLDGKQLATIEAEYKFYADESGGVIWSIATANTAVAKNKGYLVDCSAGPITLTLPATPDEGDSLAVSDFTKSSATNAITLARNGQNIMGSAEDFVVNINGAGFTIVYTNATVGWEIVSEVGLPEIYYPYTHDAFDNISTNNDLEVNGELTVTGGIGAAGSLSIVNVVASGNLSSVNVTATGAVSAATLSANGLTVDTIGSSSGDITANSNITVNGVITETSSIRYKTNVRNLVSPLESVLKLQGVMYDRSSEEVDNTGFIAEEVEKVLPGVITYKDGQVEGVKYTQLIAYLVESIKELNQKFDRLEKGAS